MANGQVTTSGHGSVVKVLSVALAGLALSASLGTVTALGNQNAALTGSSSTTATGTLVQSADRALTGRTITATPGVLFGTGRSLLQSAQGTAAPVNTQTLTGQVVTGGTGLIFPNSAGTIPLVGSSIASASGTVLTPGTRALTGLESTASAGTLTPTLRPTDPVGQAITSALGTVSIAANNVTVHITGEDIISAAGVADAMPVLTGQVSTSAAGTLIATMQVPLVGSAGTLSQGTMTIEQAPSEDTYIQSAQGSASLSSTVPLSGSASTLATGTLSITGDISQALTGSASTPAAGLLVPTPLLALIGESIQSSQENMGAPGSAVLTGQVMTMDAGTVFVTGDRTQSLTGSSFSASAGTLLARPQVHLVGVVLNGSAGTLGRSGGNMQFALTGHSSTGHTGTLGVIGQDVLPPGVSNEGCSIVSGVAEETESSPSASGGEGCFIQSGTAKEVG
jgi:hypothetical protein